ncbi:hypothetical protein AVEN_118585-1 [Araneus ventricosus]|uniref:Uncharacterized protein n=1 Tax=Araneus ventricosus TaxID=182803 RepID=A0A4Y2AVU5_ARAVE|nr:hypothetical protein AVEN_118585-1 [Araneus ventricosus]
MSHQVEAPQRSIKAPKIQAIGLDNSESLSDIICLYEFALISPFLSFKLSLRRIQTSIHPNCVHRRLLDDTKVNRPFTRFPEWRKTRKKTNTKKQNKDAGVFAPSFMGFWGDNFQECLALSSIQDHLGFLEFIPGPPEMP